MTLPALLPLLLATHAFAIRAPSADEIASLSSNTAGAYAEKNNLVALEERLQKIADSKAPDWESKLSKQDMKELSAARLRASASMSTLLEQTLIAFELVPIQRSPVGGPGIPQMPNDIMQGGEFKNTRREWRIMFAEPKEGDIKDEHGKALRGEDFQRFLERHSGMTGPDGTSIVWGNKFRTPDMSA